MTSFDALSFIIHSNFVFICALFNAKNLIVDYYMGGVSDLLRDHVIYLAFVSAKSFCRFLVIT